MPGAFEIPHALRDGLSFGTPVDTGERYDLIVVGAGLSGLAAALFFRRRAGEGARILLLDCRDEFGGHARRDEFRAGGRLLLGYGGGQSLDTPSTFSPAAAAVLKEAGVELERLGAAFDQDFYFGRGRPAVFFDRETFGRDALAAGEPRSGPGERPAGWAKFLAGSPLSPGAQEDVRRAYEDAADPWPGLGARERRGALEKTSYRDYLLSALRLRPEAAAYFQAQAHDDAALGADAVSAWWCFERGRAGFLGAGLPPPPDPRRGEPYVYHFPDGNAGVAKLLARALVPAAVPGSTMEDSVLAGLDRARLDEPGSTARIRLGAAAVRVEAESAGEVRVDYAESGSLRRARAGACVLACDHAVIPYLCPSLPGPQKLALAGAARAPLLYVNVLLRNTRAFAALGVSEIHSPGGYLSRLELDFPVDLGGYRCPRSPDEPGLVHGLRVPARPGAPVREQFRAGREELYSTPFAEIERRVLDQLDRALGRAGFDSRSDVLALTVNRWAHGYAMGAAPLVERERPAGRPWEAARAKFGPVVVANSDAAGLARAQAAIEEARRAVDELFS